MGMWKDGMNEMMLGRVFGRQKNVKKKSQVSLHVKSEWALSEPR
jgi:hypothetical protein